MTLSKTQRWLLLSAILFALPVLAASWWMLASDSAETPAAGSPAGLGNDGIAGNTASHATAAGRPRMALALGNSEAKPEADTFRSYTAEMKSQGFPESTVRELVASRVTAAYEARRVAIRNESRRGAADAAEIRHQLDALNREQGALIAQLVGAEPVADASKEADALAADAAQSGDDSQILMPAVMADAMPATVKTEEQAAAWAQLRDDFVKAIGGENQNPASPQYRKRWVQAESEADQRFRLMFGDNAYVQHQLQAQQEARLRGQAAAK